MVRLRKSCGSSQWLVSLSILNASIFASKRACYTEFVSSEDGSFFVNLIWQFCFNV